MRILWAKSDFLHPTTRGGQIRTLEMLRRLHGRHEVHYVAYADPQSAESVERAREYSSAAYPVLLRLAGRRDPRFLFDLARGLICPLPMALGRYRSTAMRRQIADLTRRFRFDSIVCDFLMLAVNFDSLERCVLFQHNVETILWRRQAESAANPLVRAFFRLQARRMFRWERHYCRQAARVVAVSEADAAEMRSMFGAERVTPIPTGVDLEYFAPPVPRERRTDLVFVGSMDWMPNIDAIEYFVREIWPLILRRKADCTVAVVGRSPGPGIRALAEKNPGVLVTGTVEDVRPHLWGAAVSVVPLRIGGGTRLKIYESMAAGVPVVSTTVGAEGLEVHPPRDIRIGDTPEEFARNCLELLDTPSGADVAAAGRRMVSERFGWDQVARRFEEVLESVRRDSMHPSSDPARSRHPG